jgi:predicted transcriptional regulator
MTGVFGNQLREFTVRNFMRRSFSTVDSDSKVSEAVKIMVDNDVACIVAVKNGKPYGIFTEEDLLHMLVRGQMPESTLVKDSMSPTIRSVTPDQPSQEAAKAMMEKKGRLLVLEAERVIGIVTPSDIVKVIYRTGRSFDISKVISKDVVMVDVNSPLRGVIERMESRRIGSVIVTKGAIPYGIFTERDLLNKVLFLGTGLDTQVGQVSTFPLVMVHLGVDGREVAGGMVSRYVRRFPLTQDGRIVGIITAIDLVKAYANIPREIADEEYARQDKVRYGDLCPLCNTRIDSTGLCGCGAGGA